MTLRCIVSFFLFGTSTVMAAPIVVTPGDLGSYKIEIDVQVDGRTRPFQLDTGANTSMVAADEETLKYSSTGKARSKGASGIPIECDLIVPGNVSFDSVSIGNPQLRRCDLGVHNFNNLGLDFLQGSILSLDFESKALTADAVLPTSWNPKVLTRLSKGHLTIPVKLGGQNYGALFDTGAQLSAVDLKFAQSNPAIFKLIQSDEVVRNIGGHPILMHVFEIVDLEVGSLKLANITVLGFEFGEIRDYLGEDAPFILGTNAIIRANWQIDLISNQWDVQPHN